MRVALAEETNMSLQTVNLVRSPGGGSSSPTFLTKLGRSKQLRSSGSWQIATRFNHHHHSGQSGRTVVDLSFPPQTGTVLDEVIDIKEEYRMPSPEAKGGDIALSVQGHHTPFGDHTRSSIVALEDGSLTHHYLPNLPNDSHTSLPGEFTAIHSTSAMSGNLAGAILVTTESVTVMDTAERVRRVV